MEIRKLNNFFKVLLFISIVWLSGCAHSISFQDLHYDIASKEYDESVVAVIDSNTLEKTVSIRSFTTGIAHRWDAKPGQMLKQVADIELPQMFEHYKFSQVADFRSGDSRGLILVMTIPNYDFRDYHSFFSVDLTVYKGNQEKVLQNSYTEEGFTQGKKMFWGGAFGMKSAVRQSSLDALQKIFQKIREDLVLLLNSDLFEEKKDFEF